MKKIKNLEDLRYRKLYLRSKIALKEQKISTQLNELKEELNAADIKNEFIRSAINNPSMIINIARLTYDLVIRIQKYKRKRRSTRKTNKS
ncbi:MAG: hypothetical protein K9H16_04825 [Bacteroidales bacterium]|nr:hypothetical protein [Bacteroidales bacterium]